jgi:hypothetical protein
MLSMAEGLEPILSIPSNPLETGTLAGWNKAERMFNIQLPADYKVFIDTYGTGCIGGFLYIWNPFGTTKNGDTLFWITKGQPDEWGIFILEARGPSYDEFSFGLNEFLIRLMKNEISGNRITPDLINVSAGFDNSIFSD